MRGLAVKGEGEVFGWLAAQAWLTLAIVGSRE
jgi:hypothetical protein